MSTRVALCSLVVTILVGAHPAGAACVGDCNGNGEVTVNELVSMVNIALETAPVSQCRNGDSNGDGGITVAEIVTAVTKALNGCAVDVSGTWVQSDTAIESSTCADSVNQMLQEDIDAGGWDCVYTVTQNGHRVTVHEDCGDGETATTTAAVDDAGMVTATDTEKETVDSCTITSTMTFSADASHSPTTVQGIFDFRFSSKCGLANCRLALGATWTRTN
jgi:hypothetical protein